MIGGDIQRGGEGERKRDRQTHYLILLVPVPMEQGLEVFDEELNN